MLNWLQEAEGKVDSAEVAGRMRDDSSGKMRDDLAGKCAMICPAKCAMIRPAKCAMIRPEECVESVSRGRSRSVPRDKFRVDALGGRVGFWLRRFVSGWIQPEVEPA